MTLSNGEKISVTLGKNKCRECVVAGWRFMEQNRTKVRSRHRIVSHTAQTSAYAKRSRKGERLTWIIPPGRAKWGLLADDKVRFACHRWGRIAEMWGR